MNFARGAGTRASQASTVSTPWLPFDMPTPSGFAASNVIVAPHAMATWRRAVQDKNIETDPTAYEQTKWVPPGGVEGTTDHRQWGGYIRNMPLGRNPLGTGYTLLDKSWEMQQVKAAGMNNMIVDILGADTFPHAQEWGAAAISEGMPRAIIAMPDASVSIVRNGPASLVSYMKQLFTGPNADGFAKHTDGRWLLMPYAPELAVNGGSEQDIIDYWVAVMQGMEAEGLDAALWPCFTRAWLTASENTALTFTKPALAPWVVGLGRWGVGNPVEAANTSGEGSYSHTTFSLPYLYSVRVEDSRPMSGVYYEAGGWDNMVTAWNVAINNPMDVIQVCTWNDWYEGSGVAPSIYHGWSGLDAMSYYVTKKRLGYWPTITRDTLYLAHRKHQGPTYNPQPTYTHDASGLYTKKMVRSGSTTERNVVDVLVFATAAADVSITVGGSTTIQAVSAGVSRVTAPLAPGTVSCKMVRSSIDVPNTQIVSPWTVNFTTQLVQDMSYMRMSSRR